MNPRSVALKYQTAARAWLTLAGLSLLLPASARLGLWLPLHLALAGAASVAISGAMQNFSLALTASRSPAEPLIWTQFVTVNAGAALIALGRPLDSRALVAVGGVSFVAGAAILLWFVRHAWSTSINRRHRLPIRMYSFAVVCVMAGGALGALMGGGAIHDPATYRSTMNAHMTINVLGWVSITIVASQMTLLPSTLRVRMPVWHGAWTAGALAGGVVLLAAGLALRVRVVAGIGSICELAGALGVAWMVSKVLRTQRRRAAPVSALHLVAGAGWFTVGSVALAANTMYGIKGFDAFAPVFLAIYVPGWTLQVLLGAWSFLLPMGRPGDPNVRRTWLVAMESAAWLQLAALNAGVALMAASAAGWLGHAAGSVGEGLALTGGGLALVKVWGFPALRHVLKPTSRASSVWRPEEI